MKKVFPLILALNLPWMAISQTVSFEGNNNYLIKIDTSQPNNIWQIGKPQKLFFNVAASPPNTIVTDTINPYPVNNLSSFQFVIKEPLSNLWGFGDLPYFMFKHKFDTDSLKDGGYIEVSYNGGNTWINAGDAPEITNYCGLKDTILGGIKAFTGFSSNNYWTCNAAWTGWCPWTPSTPDSIIIRFTFKSDNFQANKEGWMIDNIAFGTSGCPVGVINNPAFVNEIEIYPHPINTFASIRLNNFNVSEDYSFKLYNTLGGKIREEIFNKNEFLFERGDLAKGMYLYSITSADEHGNFKTIKGKLILD